MSRPAQWPPKPHLHAASGQDRVKYQGRHVYFGPTGSEQAKQRYAEWVAAEEGRRAGHSATPQRVLTPAAPAGAITVAELIRQYDAYAEGYYVKNGAPTKQLLRVRRALWLVLDSHDETPAASFGPLALAAVRDGMVALGWRRNTVNAHVGCVVLAWKWAASRELVPAASWQALAALGRLKKGRTKAAESPPAGPPAPGAVEAALPMMPPVIADMVRVQRLTGMRGGELCAMRPSDLDTSGAVWIYRPADHKTAHAGKGRAIGIGPRAQEILSRHIAFGGSHVFSPREAERDRLAALPRPKLPPKGSRRKPHPQRRPGECYTSNTYAQAVRRACLAAGCVPFHPHSLRHEAATALRAAFGLDVARAALGHEDSAMTEHYAARDLSAVVEAMRKVG